MLLDFFNYLNTGQARNSDPYRLTLLGSDQQTAKKSSIYSDVDPIICRTTLINVEALYNEICIFGRVLVELKSVFFVRCF